ncbi:hypothetical protein VPH35_105650 [Triticum aestivum]
MREREIDLLVQVSNEPDASWFDLFSKRYWEVVCGERHCFCFSNLLAQMLSCTTLRPCSTVHALHLMLQRVLLFGDANVFGTMIASPLMVKQGRKSLLITRLSGMVRRCYS